MLIKPKPKKFWNISPVWGKAATGGGITFTPTDAQAASPAFGTQNFTINIGTASADRIVTVGVQAHTGSGFALPTLNSTPMVAAAGNSTTADGVTLLYLPVSTGTTAALAFPGGADGISVTVGVLKGQSGGASATPVNPVTYIGGGAQPLSVSLTVPGGGIGVAVAGVVSGAASPTYTWTGTTAGAGDEAAGVATAQCGMAHSTSTGTVTASSSSSLSFGGTMAAAAWA